MNKIRIYIEGGGVGKETRATLRQGFGAFFSSLRDIARSRRISWDIIVSGSRDDAWGDFETALEQHSDSLNILLVDSEGPVSTTPKQHLHDRDGWNITVPAECCQLMVQTMESWLLADVEVLKSYYGQRFQGSALPNCNNVEDIGKAALYTALDQATRHTKKGPYRKITHGADLLERVRPSVVRSRAIHCDRFFKTVSSAMDMP
jgi:hypothetical protein